MLLCAEMLIFADWNNALHRVCGLLSFLFLLLMLYPLKFRPIHKNKLWGGDRLKNYCRHGGCEAARVGETWDVSAIEGSESVVENGFLQGNTLAELVEVYLGDLVGDRVYERYGNEFPLLVKLIDSAKHLSIQVHPNDSIAYTRHGTWGKTEVWYILDAAPDAFVVAGFTRPVGKEEYLRLVTENRLEEVLCKFPVKKGDAVFIPAGSVHSIGAGCVILEIQQASEITYRIYDYNRVDADGQRRELHTDLAIDAIDFDHWKNEKIELRPTLDGAPLRMVACDYFTADIISFSKEQMLDLATLDSFVLLTALEGITLCRYDGGEIELAVGETVLIPAAMDMLTLVPHGKAKLLKTYIG